MSKRQATTQLTHDNWDQEDEQEEAGQFATASVVELAQRKIRVAKRRLVGHETTGTTPKSSPFGAFAGFGSKPANVTVTATPTIAFGLPSVTSSAISSTPASTFTQSSLSASSVKAPSFGSVFTPSMPSVMSGSNLPELATRGSAAPTSSTTNVPASSTAKTTSASAASEEFFAEVKALNESVVAWLQENFEENPYVNFSPVFKDYEEHFKQLEEKHGYKESPASVNAVSKQAAVGGTGDHSVGLNGSSLAPASTEKLTFPSIVAPAVVISSATLVSATVGSTTAAPAVGSKPFSFGMPSSNSSSTSSISSQVPTFSFGSTSFSFGAKPLEQQLEPEEGGEEAEYEPPKADRVEQVEEDAFYSNRCKLFYKKNDKFMDKGTGTLFLKPLSDGKTQLLIRADTTLGNVLLNLALTGNMPCNRTGKNNVSLVCVPNPPLDPKAPSNEPAVLLIRVKTGEEADKLLDEINKRKRS